MRRPKWLWRRSRDSAGRLPRPSRAVLVEAFDDAFVVLDPRVDRVHHLTGLAAVVFDACAAGLRMTELLDELAQGGLDFEASGEDGAAAVGRVLDELWELGLVGDAAPSPEPPCLGCDDIADPMRTFPRRSWRRYLVLPRACE